MSRLKLFTIASLVTLLLHTFSLTALAQAPGSDVGEWWRPTFHQFTQKVSTPANGGTSPANEIFGERYTMAQVYWIANSIPYLLADSEVIQCANNAVDSTWYEQISADGGCLQAALQANSNHGPIIALGGAIDTMAKTKAASGIEYTANVLDKLEIVPEAYAQTEGFGFRSLASIRPLWVASRNSAYVMFTLAIMVIAFMIMFRVKLSPQTVIGVQSALPKIAIGLVLITFSYPIAGFLVDMAFVVQGIVAMLIQATTGILQGNPTPIDVLARIQDAGGGMMAFGWIVMIFSLVGGGLLNRVAPTVVQLTGATWALDIVLAIILLLFFLIAMFRIFWLFLKTYAMFVVKIIGAPWILLWTTVNPQGSFSGWIKGLVADLSVFVTVGLLIMAAHMFVWTTSTSYGALQGTDNIVGQALNPYGFASLPGAPGSSTGTLPSFSYDIGTVGFLVGFAIIIGIPSFATGIRDNLLTGRGKFETDFAAPFAPAIGLGKSVQSSAERGFGGYVTGYAKSRLGQTALGQRIWPGPAQTTTGAAVGRAGAPPLRIRR